MCGGSTATQTRACHVFWVKLRSSDILDLFFFKKRRHFPLQIQKLVKTQSWDFTLVPLINRSTCLSKQSSLACLPNIQTARQKKRPKNIPHLSLRNVVSHSQIYPYISIGYTLKYSSTSTHNKNLNLIELEFPQLSTCCYSDQCPCCFLCLATVH